MTSLFVQERVPPPEPIYPVEDPRRAVISGEVHYQRGGRITTPVLVRVETITGTLVDQAWTGSSGRFEFFRLPRGSYVLVVEVPGFKTVRMPVEYSFGPVFGMTINLVSEEKDSPKAEGASVSVGELHIPANARNEYSKGTEALANKKTDESLKHFRKAIQIYPEYDDAYVQLAWIHYQQHAYPDAQQMLDKALRLNDKNAVAHALLGSVRRQENRLPEAVQEYERSLSLEEASWRAHLELAETLLKLGEVDQAYPHVARAHQLNPSSALVHLQFYKTLILRNDYQTAAAELDEFLKLFPQHPMAPRARQQRDALRAKLQKPQ